MATGQRGKPSLTCGSTWWSGGASIPGPTAFQAVALPTELPDRGGTARGRALPAVPTGFEPATSGLTGRRALQAAPRDQHPCAQGSPQARGDPIDPQVIKRRATTVVRRQRAPIV